MPPVTESNVDSVVKQINEKHNDYVRLSIRYRCLYYATRLVAAGSAGLLPFFVFKVPIVATALSVLIVTAAVVDSVWSPLNKWKTYSRASDLLYVAQLKRPRKYDELKTSIDVIIETEERQLMELIDLKDAIERAENTARKS